MGALTIVPDPAVAFQGFGIDRSSMALAVTGAIFVVLISAIAATMVQKANIRCEATLREQNSLFAAAQHHLPVGLSMFDREQRLTMCNPAYRRLYDLSEEMTRQGTRFTDIVLNHVRREAGGSCPARLEDARDWIAGHLAKVDSGKAFTETIELEDGRVIFKRVAPIAGGGWIDLQEDITATRRADEKIKWLAHHDALTALANRFRFRELLEQQFKCYDPRSGFALHWIDLDHFKEINDCHGHQVGDEFLKSVANRLATGLRAGDIVGRLGGDEFAVVQVGCGRKDLAEQCAARILKSLSVPHNVLGHQLCGSASIGIALAPAHGQDPDQLFASADAALYHAKTHDRGTAVVYERPSIESAAASNPLRAELQPAVDREELLLHYQPIVDLHEGKVSCLEALMRWKHPTRGMIPPSEFIPLAEESRLIVAMGNWAIARACKDAMSWPASISVSVNLSAVQIERSDVYEVVAEALAESRLDPRRLQLEITETVLMRNSGPTQRVLRKLHDLGVTIVLDDFGACFATLNYLRSFPFNKIKIDRSFVHDLPGRQDCVAIVRSVAELARELSIRSVAEGVETAASLAAVREAGYDEAQGFYLSLPVPVRAVGRAISRCITRLVGTSVPAVKAA